MTDIQTECKAQLSDLSKIPAHEFEKHFQDWMERDDVARALQAKMRYDLIRSFNKTALGQQILSQTTTTTSGGSTRRLKLSPLILALNTLVAEFLYAENCHFALSVFCTEVPYRNTLPDFESQRHFRFAEAEVFEVLEAISAPSKPEVAFTKTVTKEYMDSKENPLLLLVLKVLLEQIDKPVMKLRDVGTSIEADNFTEPYAPYGQLPPAPPPPPESPRHQSDAEAHLNKSNFRHLNKYLIMLSKKVKAMSQQFEWLQQSHNLQPAVKAPPRPHVVQSVRTRRYEKLNRSLERITENLRKMSHAKRRSKHVSTIVSAIGALSTQFSKCAINFESVSKQLLETRKHGAEGDSEREGRQQEKTYSDWVHEMRHTKNGQKFLERVEASLRKALGKQKELLRTEADMKMQHQKELLKIRYKHKVMQYLSKHPTSDLCGEAQRLNESVEYQLRQFEARHVDLLQKMHGAEDEMKTAIKAAVKVSTINIPNAQSNGERATEADTAPASGAVSAATAAATSGPAREGATDGDTASGAANVRAAGGFTPTPPLRPLERYCHETAADKFVHVVRAKMRQKELEKLEKLSINQAPVASTPNVIINFDCGLKSKSIQKEMPSTISCKSSKTPLHNKQKQISLEMDFKETPPAPPSTPTKPSNPHLSDAIVAQNHLQKMIMNFAETDHNVDVMVWNAKLRLQELEFESNQLEQNFRSYLERQRMQTATVHETMASLMKTHQTDRTVTEESHKIIEQLRAMTKKQPVTQSPTDDMASASSPESIAYTKPASSKCKDNANISKAISTVQFRNAILEAKEKLFKREFDHSQKIAVPRLNLNNVPSRTETEGDLSECLSAVEAYYYNRNFGRIESRSNVRIGDSTSKMSVTSGGTPSQPSQKMSNEIKSTTNSNGQISQELRPRSVSRKSPHKFKRQLLVSEKSSRTSMAAATVAKAMALSAAAATAGTDSTERTTRPVAQSPPKNVSATRGGRSDVGVGPDDRIDVGVGTDLWNDIGVGTGDANKNVTNTKKARRAYPNTNIGSNSDNSQNTKSSINSGSSVHNSGGGEKEHKEHSSGRSRHKNKNNGCSNELNGEKQQQKQSPVAYNVSIASEQSAATSVVACTSTTSLMSATSMVLQQSMARMYQLFAEAPIAKGTALQLGEAIPDAEIESEQWRRNVEQLQNIINNNGAFVRRSAVGPAAAGGDVEREIAATSPSVNNNKSSNIAQQQTIAWLQQQQQCRVAPMQSNATERRTTTTTTAITGVAAVAATTRQPSIAAKDNNAMQIAPDCSHAADCRITKSEKLLTNTAIATKMTTPTVEAPTMLSTVASTSTFCLNPENLSSISQTSLKLVGHLDGEKSPQMDEEEEDEEEEDVEEEQQPMGHVSDGSRCRTRTAHPDAGATSWSSIDLQLSTGGGGGHSDSGSDFW